MPDSTGAGGITSATVTVPTGADFLPVPTRSAALLVLIATILELLGRLIHSTGVTVAAAAALGAVISDGAITPRIAGLRIRRDVAARLTVGVPTTVRLTITAPAGRRGRRRPVTVRSDSPGLEIVSAVTPALGAGHQAVAQPFTMPDQRGWWTEDGTITVEAFSPLGGFVRRRTMAVAGELWVHPAPAAPLLLPEANVGRGTGTSHSLRGGSGTEFFGIREWRSGDVASAIHWRASARRSQLVVMERERPVHSSLLVAVGSPRGFDAGHWERAISRTAATAAMALRSGRAVITLCESEWASPLTARDLLDWFASLEPTTSPDPSTLATALRAAGPGCAVVWLAGLAAPAYLTSAVKAAGAGALSVSGALGDPTPR